MKAEPLERRTLLRSGLPLAWFDAGGAGVPFVFQHGLCGSAQQTAEACPSDPRIRLLTLECRGHGSSPAGAVEGLSIATFADDLIALIESTALAPVVLGGISMGAAIALRVAVRRPELVRALVLARPAWVTAAAPANMQPNAEVGELLRNGPAEPARQRFDQGTTAQRLALDAPDNLASLRGFFERAPQAVTAELLTRISADGPGVTDADVRALQMPALVIGSQSDAIHPLAHARTLAALLAQARFVEITPKSVSREAYLRDIHTALSTFIHEVSP